ncbi:MAG: dienelactone hydrolase family protein [Nitrospinae bacterium]|nr:dienelactone hydrolase family protein [Nitrospinota bacterium]
MRTLLAFFLIFSFAACSNSDVQTNGGIQTKEIDYSSGGTTLKGYLAWDDAVKGKRPGVLVVHEWWGHNEHARERARMLAELGYTALAVDMYGDGKTADHPEKAGEYMNAAMKDWEGSKARFNAAKNLLQSHATVDPERIASIGFCFGGTVSLRMAIAGSDLDAVVAFHAGLPTDTVVPGTVKAAVLVINGSNDAWLDPKAVAAFKQEMAAAVKDFKYITLEGARHAFTNKQAGEFSKKFNLPNLEYSKEADEQSWAALKDFFQRVFSKKDA